MKGFGKIQQLGKALMMPIAALPIAALLLRFGVLWDLSFMSAAGAAIFDNLPIIFGIGVAIGLAKDNAGAAGLAGAIGHLVIIKGATAINDTINMGVFSGIVGGLVAAAMYNKYHKIKLPEFLGFFGGRRFVPIITSLICTVIAAIFGYVWPFVQSGLDVAGNWMTQAGSIGYFSFGFLNRLLIPTGLHHVLNSIAWFTFGSFEHLKDGAEVIANGDLHRFFAGDKTAGVFMGGFYPVIMFGLPAAALAIYTMAKKEKRKAVAGLLFTVALTSFLTGITEPLEFMFMFLAPALYVVHAILTGLSLAVTNGLGVLHGFGFSAGFIDYVINMPLATKGLLIIPIGLVFAVVYYFVFVFAIKVFNLATPGREDDGVAIDAVEQSTEKDMSEQAKQFEIALGGMSNLTNIDACITRLRLEVVDPSKIDETQLKQLGSRGIVKPSEKSIQVILGAKAEIIAQELKSLKT